MSTTVSKTVNVTIPKGKHSLRIDFVNITGCANVKFGYTPRTSAAVDKVKPLTPVGAAVAYDPATGKAKLTWSKNKEMDLARYRLYRRLKGDTSYPATPLATTTSRPADRPQPYETRGEQFRRDGRPTAQWARIAAGRDDDLGGAPSPAGSSGCCS